MSQVADQIGVSQYRCHSCDTCVAVGAMKSSHQQFGDDGFGVKKGKLERRDG